MLTIASSLVSLHIIFMDGYTQREQLGIANLLVGMTKNEITVIGYSKNNTVHGMIALDPVLMNYLLYYNRKYVNCTFLTCTSP